MKASRAFAVVFLACLVLASSSGAGRTGDSSAGSVDSPSPLPILEGDTWTYFKGTIEPPADWNQIAFIDTAWLSGASGFGYGDGDDATVLSDMQNVYLSVYTRRQFDVYGSPGTSWPSCVRSGAAKSLMPWRRQCMPVAIDVHRIGDFVGICVCSEPATPRSTRRRKCGAFPSAISGSSTLHSRPSIPTTRTGGRSAPPQPTSARITRS